MPDIKPTAPVADKKPAAPVADKKPAAPKKSGHVIADGVAITSLRGILSEGGAVCADDLTGGKKSFDILVKAGKIVRT